MPRGQLCQEQYPSAVCFLIYASFRAVAIVLFEPFCPVDIVLLFTVFTLL